MKRFIPIVLLLLVMTGCTSTQPIRKSQFISDDYNNLVQKNVTILPLIDARPDKLKDTQKLLSNKPTRDFFVSNVLFRKGYRPQPINADTGKCGSLAEVNNIGEITCLNNELFNNGDLFLLISIDQYVAPKGMHVTGSTKVTGVLYSKSANAFIWKDTIEGNYAGLGYMGMLLIKSLSANALFRNNAYSAISVLLDSIPPLPKKN